MAKIYTKTGDQGETCLVSGEKVLKSHARLESYGTLDELNSVIGLVRAQAHQTPQMGYNFDSFLEQIQNNLFNIGSQLANTDLKLQQTLPNISEKDILFLEKNIDEMTAQLAPLKNFILPGGGIVAATLHLARTVCRRAERLTIHLRNDSAGNWQMDPLIIPYINRLSDLFFVMARYANHVEKISDVEWTK